jgi:signal transduction histidine kinase
VVHDAERKPIRMIGAMIDVTAKKRAYATLEQAHARLQWLSRGLQKAEEKERHRLSRELHDEFGQLLSALRLSLARIREEVMKPSATKGMVLKKNVMAATKTADLPRSVN